MDWTKATARRCEKHSSVGIWCNLYEIFDGKPLPLCPPVHFIQPVNNDWNSCKQKEISSFVLCDKTSTMCGQCEHLTKISQFSWRHGINCVNVALNIASPTDDNLLEIEWKIYLTYKLHITYAQYGGFIPDYSNTLNCGSAQCTLVPTKSHWRNEGHISMG